MSIITMFGFVSLLTKWAALKHSKEAAAHINFNTEEFILWLQCNHLLLFRAALAVMLCLHRLHLDHMSFYSQSGCVQPGLYIWAIFHRIFVEGQEFLSGTVDGLSAFVEWNIEPLIITICGWCLVGTVYDPIHDNILIQDGGLCRCHRERGKHFIFRV